jgi:hypothetical protein
MIPVAVLCSLFSLGSDPAAAQQRARVVVAVIPAEASDSTLKRAAARLTDALNTTAAANGAFSLYDTTATRKAVLDAGRRSVPSLPARYTALARVTPALAGWAQATISFVDAPGKEPVVRVSSPVLLSSDSSFESFARFAWERLLKSERKNL